MNIEITSITDREFANLFCKSCVYWEEPGQFRSISPEEGEKIKAKWFEAEGNYGKLLYADDIPAAYCQYALPERLPGIQGYGGLASQVDPDALFISCLTVIEGYRGKGLGKMLLEKVIEEAGKQGYNTVETFARDDSTNNCSGPTQLYLRQGFEVVANEIITGVAFSLVKKKLITE